MSTGESSALEMRAANAYPVSMRYPIRTAFLVLAFAVACDRSEPPTKAPAAPPPPPAPAAAPAPKVESAPPPTTVARTTGPFEVVDLEVGTSIGADGRIANPSDRLPSSDTIHAVVVTAGRREAISLTARWGYANKTNLGTQTQAFAADATTPPAFHITKAGGWPKGDYRVEIFKGDLVLVSKDFVVE